MNVTNRDVEHVAVLARLHLSPAEKELYTGQFNVILEHINRLNELELAGVEPTTYVQPVQNVFRADVEKDSPRELLDAVLKEAPDREKGLFRVPPVME